MIYFPPSFSAAQRCIDEVRTACGGDANHLIYVQFIQILKEFRLGDAHSSIVFSSLQTLFQNHPNLLDAVNAFNPRNCSAAVEDEGGDVTAASVDFMNQVKLRFDGSRVYSEFLNVMQAYSHRMMSVSEARDEVIGLFGKGNDDLVDRFMAFLPQSLCSKERTIRVDDFEGESRKKIRVDDFEGESWQRRRRRGEGRKKNMEDYDVRIWNLKSCTESAERLIQLLSDGSVKAADFRVADHFTALNVACMRRLDRKIVEQLGGDVVRALPRLLKILFKNNINTLEEKMLNLLKIPQSGDSPSTFV